ncbi:MAG TPA: HAD family hydrolase [Verrucomicrobiales bacterium]|nr:HAD family hydrolase [Verrucomicrobiales bacterium]
MTSDSPASPSSFPALSGSGPSASITPIQALTFDLWDTIVHDDSDEAKRAAAGLRSKRDERRRLVWQALEASGPIPFEHVALAYDTADAAFNKAWKELHVTWPIEQRLDLVLQGLGRSQPPGWASVIEAHQRMELTVAPDLIPGCREALTQLSARYPLAIVSDAIVSPGWALRELLELHGVKHFFTAFAFSDEVGRSKPHHDMFAAAASQLQAPLAGLLHIGDRDHNDVRGPHALGMRAVLFTGARAADKAGTQADAICDSWNDLPNIIDRLAREA